MNRFGQASKDCEALGALLVDYADAATSQADSARVERHVADCGACRTELAALRRSLTVLESVWAEPSRLHLRRVQPQTEIAAMNREHRLETSARLQQVGCTSAECSLNRPAGATTSIQFDRKLPASTRFQASLGGSEAYRWRIAAALGGVAAAVALAIGVFRAGQPMNAPAPAIAIADEVSARAVEPAAIETDVHDLDIEAFIQRQEQSARLAASLELLTSLPVEREDAERAQRYLRDAYGIDHIGAASVESGEL